MKSYLELIEAEKNRVKPCIHCGGSFDFSIRRAFRDAIYVSMQCSNKCCFYSYLVDLSPAEIQELDSIIDLNTPAYKAIELPEFILNQEKFLIAVRSIRKSINSRTPHYFPNLTSEIYKADIRHKAKLVRILKEKKEKIKTLTQELDKLRAFYAKHSPV